ncbi:MULTISPECIES: serine hydrolase [unclassified Caballeronia]|uniref:serine hydrolase domain-containing protein n=1 Tax=unclassified Caballeronia TaxID=2646786 RepID=UPI00285B119D|nr:MULTISPECIES: serine hydrolase [unclassified Caballeronia]MDR5752247.1 serine hydrolase [Caballeronia sp. LZ024]MDR5841765.1 serine hydrolase [Caballeronia sp. LZ031]
MFEHFRHDVQPSDLQEINSVTKSVVGMLAGIALRVGALRDMQQVIGEFLPEARSRGVDERVRNITIEQLLTMTSGFDWDERTVDECLLGACSRLGGERLRFILSRPLAYAPGTHFNYDSHATHLLSIVLARATGRALDRFAHEALFDPLDIERCEWIVDEEGYAFAGRGLSLTTRDMAKLGLVMLSGGEWQGKRLLDESYAREAAMPHSAGGWPVDDARYGYLWWVEPRGCFATGFGEQYIFVVPEERIVAAVSSDNNKAPKHARSLFDKYVRDARAG